LTTTTSVIVLVACARAPITPNQHDPAMSEKIV
jgi:hypothetical protein